MFQTPVSVAQKQTVSIIWNGCLSYPIVYPIVNAECQHVRPYSNLL